MEDAPPMKYSHKTRLGNWNEERVLEETKGRDYQKKRVQGALETSKLQQRLQYTLRPGSVTYSRDGLLHFGDQIQLLNKKTDGFMGCDVSSRYVGHVESYGVTTNPRTNATLRSTFGLIKYEQDEYKDNILRYGQKIVIQVNPRIFSKPLFLHSVPISPERCAKISRRQEVTLTPNKDFNCVWIPEHVDARIRFEMNGQQIKANEPILLTHAFTTHYLASDLVDVKNDYGTEYEVFGHSFLTHNKTQNLIAEKTGRNTVDIPMRGQFDQNVWVLVTATDPSKEFNEEIYDRGMLLDDLFEKLRYLVFQRGVYGLRGLTVALRNLDQSKSGRMDLDDLRWGFRNYNLPLSPEEINLVQTNFSRGDPKFVDYAPLLIGLRIPLSQGRLSLIKSVYDRLRASFPTGKFTLEDLCRIYDVKGNPEVIRGMKPEKEAYKEFVAMWGAKSGDIVVTWEDFVDYYHDISSCVESDEAFEEIICNVWKKK